MKFARSCSFAVVIATVGAPSWVAANDKHHPAGTTSGSTSKSAPGKPSAEMAHMDTHMKDMQQMHDKMVAAKTPEERNALMGEHMKTMQAGMTMMNSMPKAGMGGGMKGDMASHHQTMEKRMEMMQMMMQMMMDRLPAVPAK